MKAISTLSLLVTCCAWLFAGNLMAQGPEVDKLKERLNEIQKRQKELQAQEAQLRAEEAKLAAELARLEEFGQDKLLADFTGTLYYDGKASLYKVVMKHSGRKEWEQTIWLWITDDPKMEARLKTLVDKRIKVQGYLFQHDGKEFREGGGRIPTSALYVVVDEVTEYVRGDEKR
jgi:hypothetical protein